jgi:hypothetical protein
MNHILKLLTILTFLALLLPGVFRPGIFMDGLIYSTVAHNMANGVGTFWQPSFSATVMSSFHEHPPLAMGIQSLFFRLFGDAFYVEKVYSFLTALITAYLIIILWKKSTPQKHHTLSWWPVFLWITVQPVFWSYNNNMLENTMGLFSLLAVILLFESLKRDPTRQVIYHILASASLIMAFLSKGFPGLFPLGFYFCYYLAYHREYDVGRMLRSTLQLIAVFVTLTFLFLFWNQPALQSLADYMQAQLFPALAGESMEKPWYHIMKALALQTTGTIGLSFIILLLHYRMKINGIIKDAETLRGFFLFLMIGLSATAPMMVSPKQLTFYIVPSIPYFGLAFGYLTAHILHSLNERVQIGRKWNFIFKLICYVAILAIVAVSIFKAGQPVREKSLISDVRKIGSMVPEGSIVSASPALHNHYSLMGYLQRMYFISMHPSEGQQYPLYLQISGKELPPGYHPVDIDLEGFFLARTGM